MDKIIDKKIVIDSCVLIYFCEDNDGGKTEELINMLKENNNGIFMSDISGFEVLKNRQDSEKSINYEKLLNSIEGIPVDSPVFMNAATLCYLYKKIRKVTCREGEEMDPKDKLTGDLIIGGTVLSYENYLLLTSNKKDFPEPYWEVIATGEVGSVEKIKIYLMRPNIAALLSEIQTMEDIKMWPTKKRMHGFRG